MKTGIAVATVIVLGLIAIACGEQPAPGPSPEGTAVHSSTPVPSTTVPSSESASASTRETQTQGGAGGASPTATPEPLLPGITSGALDHVRLDLGDGIAVAFADDPGLGRVAYVTHVPSGAQAVLDTEGNVKERHDSPDKDGGLLDAVLGDAEAMAHIRSGLGYDGDLPGNPIADWLDVMRFNGLEFHLASGEPQLNQSQLGTVLYRVAFKLDANWLPSEYQIQDGDAALLEPGTAIHSANGYGPSLRLAAVVNDAILLYESSPQGPDPIGPAVREALNNIAKDPMARIAERVPGFGGAFRDSSHNIVYIYLQDASMQEEAERALTKEFGPDFFKGREVQVLEGEYSMDHLAAWYESVKDVAWQVPGISWSDLDEGKNRIEIGMYPRRGGREEMEAALAIVDVPRGAIVIEVGCKGISPWPLDVGEPPDEVFLSAIDYSLEVVPQAAYGETVGLKLSLRNVSGEPVSFYLGGRPPYDFVVSTAEGEQVWRWKCAKITLLPLDSETLAPGEELEFIGEWEQVDNRGGAVPPGAYLVRGVLDLDWPEKLVTGAHGLEVLR